MPFMLIYVLLVLLINVLQGCVRGELRLRRELVKDKTNNCFLNLHVSNYF